MKIPLSRSETKALRVIAARKNLEAEEYAASLLRDEIATQAKLRTLRADQTLRRAWS